MEVGCRVHWKQSLYLRSSSAEGIGAENAEPPPPVERGPKLSDGFMASRLGCGALVTDSPVQVVEVTVVEGAALLPFSKLSMVKVARLVGEVVDAFAPDSPALSRLLSAPLSMLWCAVAGRGRATGGGRGETK